MFIIQSIYNVICWYIKMKIIHFRAIYTKLSVNSINPVTNTLFVNSARQLHQCDKYGVYLFHLIASLMREQKKKYINIKMPLNCNELIGIMINSYFFCASKSVNLNSIQTIQAIKAYNELFSHFYVCYLIHLKAPKKSRISCAKEMNFINLVAQQRNSMRRAWKWCKINRWKIDCERRRRKKTKLDYILFPWASIVHCCSLDANAWVDFCYFFSLSLYIRPIFTHASDTRNKITMLPIVMEIHFRQYYTHTHPYTIMYTHEKHFNFI